MNADVEKALGLLSNIIERHGELSSDREWTAGRAALATIRAELERGENKCEECIAIRPSSLTKLAEEGNKWRARAEKAEAEVDRLNTELGNVTQLSIGWAKRAEKAEAELEVSDKSWDIKQKQLEEAQAELEAARPLIKAALEWDGTMRNAPDLQTAALAYREKKGKGNG